MYRALMLLGMVTGFFKKLWGFVRAFDERMRARNQPARFTAIAVAAIAALMVIMLCVPPCIGLSNDGSFDNVLADTGLARINADDSETYFNYYERTYKIVGRYAVTPNTTPLLLRITVSLAVDIDIALTGDDLFDMRYLAALYMIVYLAALWPLIYALVSRVKAYTQALFITLLCVAVFADVSIVTRFASLYTQPWALILFLFILDMLLEAAKDPENSPCTYLLILPVALLISINPYYALAGIVFSAIYWRLVLLPIHYASRGVFVILALVLCVLSVRGVVDLDATRTKSQRYNQMTRGVLFQAENPEQALADFGIEPRYSILTETYADQSFPAVLPEGGLLDTGFLDRYTTPDVLLYYAAHPTAMISLMDVGTRSAFVTRPDFSGNYERSAGMPPRAKSLFMSVWSTFKDRTAPKTIGFVLLLFLALLFIRRRKQDAQSAGLLQSLLYPVFAFAFVQLATVLVYTGDSELVRESYYMSVNIDCLMVIFISEVLHRIDTLGEGMK